MEYITLSHSRWVCAALCAFAFFLPTVGHAATTKKTLAASGGVTAAALAHPVSRCVTTASKAAHQKNLKIYADDAKRLQGKKSASVTQAYKKYKTILDYAWGAMTEPYCGYGSNGYSAAFKSYQKTVTRARSAFLTAAKK